MKIIKRNGSEVAFDRVKIVKAIEKANESGDGKPELTKRQIDYISFVIEDKIYLSSSRLHTKIS